MPMFVVGCVSICESAPSEADVNFSIFNFGVEVSIINILSSVFNVNVFVSSVNMLVFNVVNLSMVNLYCSSVANFILFCSTCINL